MKLGLTSGSFYRTEQNNRFWAWVVAKGRALVSSEPCRPDGGWAVMMVMAGWGRGGYESLGSSLSSSFLGEVEYGHDTGSCSGVCVEFVCVCVYVYVCVRVSSTTTPLSGAVPRSARILWVW